MAKRRSYPEILRQEMGELIDQLDLPKLYKQSMERRWLDQVLWMEKKASQCQRWHNRLRLTAVVGGVILPALVGVNFLDNTNKTLKLWFPYVTFGLSQAIAVSVAVEEFCRYGDRWRQYRQTAENLKTEGWQYFQLSGQYEQAKNHANAYPLFAAHVESVIQNDVKNYITELVKQKEKEQEDVDKVVEVARGVQLPTQAFVESTPIQPMFAQSGVADMPYASSLASEAIATVSSSPEVVTAAMPTGSPSVVASSLTSNGTPLDAPIATPLSTSTTAPKAVPMATSLTASTPAAASTAPAPTTPVPQVVKGNAGILRLRQDSVFKLSPKPAESLSENEKILVKGGSAYGLHSYSFADNNHLRVALAQVGLGPDKRNTWFLFAPHAEIEGISGKLMPTSNPAASESQPKSTNQDIHLKVPYFSQVDNKFEPNRTCNTSSCAMVAKFLGANISGDDAYYQYVIKYGDTTDHGVQTQALEDLGIKSTWNTDLDFSDLDKSLETGLPIVIGIMHRGSLENPTGGHMIVVVGRTPERDYICNDPYGSVLDGYTSDPSNGKGVVYPRNMLRYRWLEHNTPKTGWGRLFYGNKV
ncbi:MAG: DUF4231 domain-containing protein [Scytolyngbya sp. HA4215-MV1]|jgi:hypothetical protein|nr:DUF4231 domain-containing protein [Scytolyngbya sp. HA4215-MV1]